MRIRARSMLALAAVSGLGACTDDITTPLPPAISARVVVGTQSDSKMLSLASTSLEVGDTTTMLIDGRLMSRYARTAKRLIVTFVSRDTSVAAISPTARVTMRGYGSSWIVVRMNDRPVDSIGVSVTRSVQRDLPVMRLPDAPDTTTSRPDAVFTDTVSVLPTQATLPKRFVTHTYPVPSRTVVLKQGDDLQAAVDTARRGDEIVLADGATFKPVRLRKKAAAGWITIRSQSTPVVQGIRVTPTAVAKGAKIITTQNAQPAIETDRGASGYWISGIEVATSSSVTLMYALVAIDAQSSVAADIPTNIVLDRMYVHGHDKLEMQRCVRFDAGNAAIVDSWISECHIHGFDSQAVLVLTSPGQMLLRNNFLEGAGENVMLGGGSPAVVGMFPEDVEIVGNHFYKPIAWQAAGWSVKNLFEIKYGRRIDVRDNYFENNWVSAQAGTAILLRATDQEGAPWVRTSDLVFRRNVVANSAHGISIAADQMIGTNRVAVLSNEFRNMGMNSLGGSNGGRLVQLYGKLDDIEIRHNTMLFGTVGSSAASAIMMDGSGSQRLTIVNNIFEGGEYGAIRSGSGPGLGSLNGYATAPEFSGNVMSLRYDASYGTQNTVVSSVGAMGFESLDANVLRLGSSSTVRTAGARGATPGVPAGALVAALASRSKP